MNELGQESAGPKTYQMPSTMLGVGVVSTVVYLAITTYGIVAIETANSSMQQHLENGIFFICLFGSMTLLGVWLIAAYFRYRLVLGKQTIRQRGVIRTREVRLSDVILLKWRVWPGYRGSVVIRTSSRRMAISFNSFPKSDADAIACLIRTEFPEEIQRNFAAYQAMVDEQLVETVTIPRRRRQLDVAIAGVLFLGCAGLFVYVWSIGGGPESLIIGIITAIGSLAYLGRIFVVGDLRVKRRPRIIRKS